MVVKGVYDGVFHCVMEGKLEELVSLLSDVDANIDWWGKCKQQKTQNSPLHTAAQYGHPHIIK